MTYASYLISPHFPISSTNVNIDQGCKCEYWLFNCRVCSPSSLILNDSIWWCTSVVVVLVLPLVVTEMVHQLPSKRRRRNPRKQMKITYDRFDYVDFLHIFLSLLLIALAAPQFRKASFLFKLNYARYWYFFIRNEIIRDVKKQW